MPWIWTPNGTKWPEKTPDGVSVGTTDRVTNETHTGCGYPFSEKDRAALMALPGAKMDPPDYDPKEMTLQQRCVAHSIRPGIAIRCTEAKIAEPVKPDQKLRK